MTLFGVDKRVVSKRVVSADVPPERKPERGYIRQNRPFTKPPFYLPVSLRAWGFSYQGSRGVPKNPSTLGAQRLKKFKILKFSSEIENFKRATHQTPIFVGNSEGRDWNFQSRLKFSSEIENFKRDWFFSIFGPSGQRYFSYRAILAATVSQNSFVLVFVGCRTIIARYVAKWGIAQMCLCETKYQGGISRHFGGVLTSLKKYRAIWA